MDKIFIYSAHEKGKIFNHSFCYSRNKEYSCEKVAEILKEEIRQFQDSKEIVVRVVNQNELHQVGAYQQVINLQPSIEEMRHLRNLINRCN